MNARAQFRSPCFELQEVLRYLNRHTIRFMYMVEIVQEVQSPQYLKLLNTSEIGENPAVLFCFDFLPRPSKKHKKIPFL